jgi:hypothetical protein
MLKENKIIFLDFLKYYQVLMTLINWLLKSKYMLKHIFLKFSLLYENTIWLFLLWETWPYAWKQTCFFKKMLWWKPGILIPDLYFYDIKIKINIKQNSLENMPEKSQIFKNIFLKIVFGLGWTFPA